MAQRGTRPRPDLGDARLVVGAEQRRAVGRDDVVADTRREQRALVGTQRLARVAGERDVAAVVAAHDLRLHVVPDSSGLVSTWAISRAVGPAAPGSVAKTYPCSVSSASSSQLAQLRAQQLAQVALLRGARVRGRRRSPTAVSTGRSGGTASSTRRRSPSPAASGYGPSQPRPARRGTAPAPQTTARPTSSTRRRSFGECTFDSGSAKPVRTWGCPFSASAGRSGACRRRGRGGVAVQRVLEGASARWIARKSGGTSPAPRSSRGRSGLRPPAPPRGGAVPAAASIASGS